MREFDDRLLHNKQLTSYRKQEEESLIKALAEKNGLSYVNLRGVSIDPEALFLIEESDARNANIVAFEKGHKNLSVALRNPNNPKTKEVLASLSAEHNVAIFMCSTASLEHAWERYEDRRNTTAVAKGVLDIDPEEIEMLRTTLTSREKVAEHIKEIRTLNSSRRLTETIDTLFAGALALHASDIHIEPEEGGVRLRYRLDGVLHDVIDLERSIYNRLASRIKLLAGLILNIHDKAQDGRFTFKLSEREIEVRTSIIPGASGESIVMRLLDPTVASFNIETLGLNPRLTEVMEAELTKPNGLIVTTGPTGSGKTTALYAFLRKVHTPEVKIITIEDPVEYLVDDIVQTQIEDDYTFASGLRSILRQDPDIIMVGEIRDRDVAETAIQAAQTGHLVFSTLHTNNAVGAFPRLIDLGVQDRMIANSVNIVLGQRLIRTLCSKCKEAYTADDAEYHLVQTIAEKHPQTPTVPHPLTLFRPTGCTACSNTGFEGRVGIFEAIIVDEAVEEAVIRDPRDHIIEAAAAPQKIPTMTQDGIEKVLTGITSLTELARVVDITAPNNTIKTKSDDGDAVAEHTVTQKG